MGPKGCGSHASDPPTHTPYFRGKRLIFNRVLRLGIGACDLGPKDLGLNLSLGTKDLTWIWDLDPKSYQHPR